jgi:ribosome-interacting GTPase 1
MPANLSPEYKAAEAAFRKARDPKERLDHLREMLRVIPKHKGTDHLQAEIKKRIKDLTSDLSGAARTGARTGPATHVTPEGAAQIALLGPPNSGKSTLHAALTGSHTEVGPYPFTTQFPQPGMYVYEDISFQIVDLPPIAKEHPIPWIVNALQPADACLLVVDVGEPECVDLVVAVHDLLEERRILLTETWPADASNTEDPDSDDLASFTMALPTLLVATKSDLYPEAREELQILEELAGYSYPTLSVSVGDENRLNRIGAWLAEKLEIVRVYTKIPGQAADMTRPFTVRRGETVADVARLVHRDMAEGVKFARIWGRESFDGQQVGREHIVSDGDVLELHA